MNTNPESVPFPLQRVGINWGNHIFCPLCDVPTEQISNELICVVCAARIIDPEERIKGNE